MQDPNAQAPAFLESLISAFRTNLPHRADFALSALNRFSEGLGITPEEWKQLGGGMLSYYFLFVEPLYDLSTKSSIPFETIAELQLLAILHWRCVDTLMDLDEALLSAHRHREFALKVCTRLREEVIKCGVDWEGAAGREYSAFYNGSRLVDVGPAPSGDTLLDAFLTEHFDFMMDGRGSFLLLIPKYVLRLDGRCLAWYRYYVSVMTLDDDLDDVLSDVLQNRDSALARFFQRVGLFRPGRAKDFAVYHKMMSQFLLNRIKACNGIAESRGYFSSNLVLERLGSFLCQKYS